MESQGYDVFPLFYPVFNVEESLSAMNASAGLFNILSAKNQASGQGQNPVI